MTSTTKAARTSTAQTPQLARTTKPLDFELPFFRDIDFTIKPGTQLCRLAEGAHVLSTIIAGLLLEIPEAHSSDGQHEDLAHAARVLQRIVEGATKAIAYTLPESVEAHVAEGGAA